MLMTKFGGRGQEVMTRSPDCLEFDVFSLVRLYLHNSAGCSSLLTSRDCAEWAPHGSDSERLGRSLAAGASRDHPKIGFYSLGVRAARCSER